MITGRNASNEMTRAIYGPGARSCRRAGFQMSRNNARLRICTTAVYLLSRPRPSQRPVSAHLLIDPVVTAHQPEIIASTQKRTDGASTVSNVEPRVSIGVAPRIRI